MEKKKMYLRTMLWTIIVWLISFVCYLPMLLEKSGVFVPPILTAAKYLFVIVPLAVSAIFAAYRRGFKKWLSGLFAEKVKAGSIILCAAAGVTGLAFSFVYSLAANEPNMFSDSYPTFFSVIAGSAYLFITALAEESAWRGFLLSGLSESGSTTLALIYTGIAWAVWHIPMWTIRNSLGLGETALYFIWTFLLSLVLGKFFCTYKNVITAAMLHMLFNVCFIAPVQYNTVLLVLAAAAVFVCRHITGRYGRS